MLLRRATRLRRPVRHLLAPSRSCSAGGGHRGAEVNLSEVRQLLSEHAGGSVDLTLDDDTGVASLRLNHTEKKNALSGEFVRMIAALPMYPLPRGDFETLALPL